MERLFRSASYLSLARIFINCSVASPRYLKQTYQPLCQLIVIVTPATSEAITAWLADDILSTASVNIHILKSHGSQTQEAAINEVAGQQKASFCCCWIPVFYLSAAAGWRRWHVMLYGMTLSASRLIYQPGQSDLMCRRNSWGSGPGLPVGYAERWGNAGYLSRYQSDCSYSTLPTDCLLIRKTDGWRSADLIRLHTTSAGQTGPESATGSAGRSGNMHTLQRRSETGSRDGLSAKLRVVAFTGPRPFLSHLAPWFWQMIRLII